MFSLREIVLIFIISNEITNQPKSQDREVFVLL